MAQWVDDHKDGKVKYNKLSLLACAQRVASCLASPFPMLHADSVLTS